VRVRAGEIAACYVRRVQPPETFDKIAREPRLSAKVADAILQTIVSEQLRPGDALPSERALEKQFGVSRTVIREAVGALTAKGLLDVKTGRGARVISVGADGVAESMRHFMRGSMLDYPKVAEVRKVLEVSAAGLAAERATTRDLAAIRAAFDRMAVSGHDVGAAAQADLDFHRAIAAATHNELFPLLHDSIGESLLEVRRSNLSLGEQEFAKVMEFHRAILAGLERRDPGAASAAMDSHLAHVEAAWREVTARQGAAAAGRVAGNGGATLPPD
jgi:GntR family transcriptional regulator, transcriptional repressor for pyruvate dehydrogenase complex